MCIANKIYRVYYAFRHSYIDAFYISCNISSYVEITEKDMRH